MNKIKLYKIQAKEIFTKSKLPGCDYVVNQYVGCEHACSYCYARFISRWKKHGEWGTWVEAKINAPELVKNRFVFLHPAADHFRKIVSRTKMTAFGPDDDHLDGFIFRYLRQCPDDFLNHSFGQCIDFFRIIQR